MAYGTCVTPNDIDTKKPVRSSRYATELPHFVRFGAPCGSRGVVSWASVGFVVGDFAPLCSLAICGIDDEEQRRHLKISRKSFAIGLHMQ